MMPIVSSKTRTTTTPAMISEGSGMTAPDSWVPVRDGRDGHALASRVRVLDAEAIADLHRQRGVVFAQRRRELHDTAVAHERDDPTPVAKRHDGLRLGQQQSVERGARLPLKAEEQIPHGPDHETLDQQRG